MRYFYISLLIVVSFFSCKNETTKTARTPISKSKTVEKPASKPDDLSAISTKDFREFKVLDSKYLTKVEIWESINPQLEDFTKADYERLKPFILEQDIPALQAHILAGKLTYEQLTKFYLYRIRQFDRENEWSLNSVISINPNVINQAISLDKNYNAEANLHPIYGMPILLKDNINAKGMATTAGAVALKHNITEDAFLVSQLKRKGALILGKTNLSEWAYFFCGDCPSGYSAIGGQTLNPYGRRVIDTGGSSSGSGVAVATNFCAAAIGSETSGSILSPASQNSVVGLKPTVGLVSRSGIVPISSTLDTAGPMTKNVMDNAIVLDAIYGEDQTDSKSIYALWQSGFYFPQLKEATLKGKRFGAPKRLLKDSLFMSALSVLKAKGAIIVEVEETKIGLPHFLNLLNIEMKHDLPLHLNNYGNKEIEVHSVADVVNFNKKDSVNRMPYGQKLFKGIVAETGDKTYLERVKDTLKTNGLQFFNVPMQTHNLDAYLSINNYHAGYAAVAEYPALTVPMGYTKKGAPKGLTFIAKRLQEKQLLEWAYVYEQATKHRQMPKNYE